LYITHFCDELDSMILEVFASCFSEGGAVELLKEHYFWGEVVCSFKQLK